MRVLRYLHAHRALPKLQSYLRSGSDHRWCSVPAEQTLSALGANAEQWPQMRGLEHLVLSCPRGDGFTAAQWEILGNVFLTALAGERGETDLPPFLAATHTWTDCEHAHLIVPFFARPGILPTTGAHRAIQTAMRATERRLRLPPLQPHPQRPQRRHKRLRRYAPRPYRFTTSQWDCLEELNQQADHKLVGTSKNSH